jgi:hypothetical protein
MAPMTTGTRQPVSHEWRRHSLVKVRRPVWSGHPSPSAAPDTEGTPAQVVNTSLPQVSSQTTADDIAW